MKAIYLLKNQAWSSDPVCCQQCVGGHVSIGIKSCFRTPCWNVVYNKLDRNKSLQFLLKLESFSLLQNDSCLEKM